MLFLADIDYSEFKSVTRERQIVVKTLSIVGGVDEQFSSTRGCLYSPDGRGSAEGDGAQHAAYMLVGAPSDDALASRHEKARRRYTRRPAGAPGG